MLRVLFVHTVPKGRPGGAELSLCHHIQGAPHSVRVDMVEPDEQVDLDRYDGVVLGNLRPHGGLGAEAELTPVIHWAAQLSTYLGFSLRSERDVHPCTYRDGRCLIGQSLRKTACDCTSTMRDANELLYNTCSAVQFLSPVHQQAINQLIDVRTPQHVIAAPIDFDRFRATVPAEKRIAKALVLGDEIRVADSAEQRARDHGYEPETVDYLSIPHKKMPALYNQYQAVVVDPVMLHAFGRIAVEALACGCKVLASDRVGAMSWPNPLQASREANDKFWSLVTEGCHTKCEVAPRRNWPWRNAS